MCLGIPMQVLEIDGHTARCVSRGVERTVSLFLLQEGTVRRGDSVMVHVGYAIQKIDPREARERWRLFTELEREADGAARDA